MSANLQDEELLRYSKHVLLPEIAATGQKKLKNAHVLHIGAGGIGSASLPYLAASGVGRITVFDPDTISLDNLQRQILYNTHHIGLSKASIANQVLKDLNPHIKIDAHPEPFTIDNGSTWVKQADLIIDATDNFKTRFLINELAKHHQKPYLMGAAIGLKAHWAQFNGQPESPCYQCLYPHPAEQSDQSHPRCIDAGILSPLVGMIGTQLATSAIMLLLGKPAKYGILHQYDALKCIWRTTKILSDRRCRICRTNGTTLESHTHQVNTNPRKISGVSPLK